MIMPHQSKHMYIVARLGMVPISMKVNHNKRFVNGDNCVHLAPHASHPLPLWTIYFMGGFWSTFILELTRATWESLVWYSIRPKMIIHVFSLGEINDHWSNSRKYDSQLWKQQLLQNASRSCGVGRLLHTEGFVQKY